MRKLKLQVQISVDGYVAGPSGELDWLTWDEDEQLGAFIDGLTDSCDTILLGRKMADGFVTYWEDVVHNQPESHQHAFAKKMVDYPKFVFSKTLKTSPWNNTKLATGNVADEVSALKRLDGRDIIVYGGATFVSSLIKGGHIDEFHLFINPVLINKGLRIFDLGEGNQKLSLMKAVPYNNGVTVVSYSKAS